MTAEKNDATNHQIGGQKRRIHTYRNRSHAYQSIYRNHQPYRTLHLAPNQALNLLQSMNVPIFGENTKPAQQYEFCVTVDRTQCRPCLIAEQAHETNGPKVERTRKEFSYADGLLMNDVDDMVRSIGLSRHLKHQLPPILKSLVLVFKQKEAFLVKARVVEGRNKQLSVYSAQMIFDDSAFRIGKRNLDIEKLRRVQDDDADEVEAEKYGIVYIK